MITEDGLILVGDEAYTPEEWAAGEPARQRRRERDRARYPERAAAQATYYREWVARNREHVREYHREWARLNRLKLGMKPHTKRRVAVKYEQGSLHDFACGGPTKATGCVCRKVLVSKRAD